MSGGEGDHKSRFGTVAGKKNNQKVVNRVGKKGGGVDGQKDAAMFVSVKLVRIKPLG